MKDISYIQKYQEFDNLEFIAKQVVEGFITGLHRSPFHGFSVEFAEHRLYNSGESTKHIDWRLFARTEKLFIKKYQEETNLRSHIVIDTSSSMLFPFEKNKINNKLSFSIYCAASLIYLLRKQRDAVGLSLFSDNLELHTKSKTSNSHIKMLYAELNNLLNQKLKNYKKKITKTSNILHLIAENVHKRSLIIIFSDMFEKENKEDLFSAIQHLRYNKHEVILFHVKDKKQEQNFEYKNRPYKFIDLETGEQMKFNPNDLRENYVKKINDYFSEIKLKCGQYKIDFIESDINEGFKKILMPFLLKRKKLF
ncbi:MAG: DUF58 domain-containing protein [Bacteroidetes bacterium 4572_128]|nr:MAG: DUF58 domain-containing protein [Bacteroidetes bacterium 4572_128]